MQMRNTIVYWTGIVTVSICWGCGLFVGDPMKVEHSLSLKTMTDSAIVLSDNTVLFAQSRFYDNSDAIVVCIPGLGAHSESFNALLDVFRTEKISFVAYDVEGFGRSSGERGTIDNFGRYLLHLDLVINEIHSRFPHRPLVLLGESLGSLLILWYGAEYMDSPFSTSILTSIPTTYSKGSVDISTLSSFVWSYSVCPDRKIFIGFEPESISADSAFIAWAYTSDIYAQKEISVRYLLQTKYLVDHEERFAAAFTKPVFMISGTNDIVSDREELERLFGTFPSDRKELRMIDGGMHSLVNDTTQSTVFTLILDWVRR